MFNYDHTKGNPNKTVPPGVVDFKINQAAETLSKKGVPMFRFVINLRDAQGREGVIYEYLLHEDMWIPKLRRFARAVGLLEKFETGTMDAEDFLYKEGSCRVDEKEDSFGKVNNIVKYIYPDEEMEAEKEKPSVVVSKTESGVTVLEPEDIPF